jgi:tetratricopeptide (TPR) repeat protein
MSFPSDNLSSSPPPPNGTPASPPRRRFGLRWTSWVVLLVLVGSCVIPQAPREIGRWKLAAALNARDAGRKDEAYALLEAAEKWFPINSSLLLQRAEWKLVDGQKEEALKDCDRILDLQEDMVELLKKHCQFLQDAGQFVDAVKDWKRLNQISERNGRPGRAEALNGLAYAQAVAQTELDDALDHVNEALELVPGSAGILDTRGYLLYLTDRNEAALADMNTAVQAYEKGYGRNGPPQEEYPATRASFLNSEPRTIREVRATENPTRADMARGVAIIHYHRALVLRALGREKEAEEDLARAKQLIGREPDETLF